MHFLGKYVDLGFPSSFIHSVRFVAVGLRIGTTLRGVVVFVAAALLIARLAGFNSSLVATFVCLAFGAATSSRLAADQAVIPFSASAHEWHFVILMKTSENVPNYEQYALKKYHAFMIAHHMNEPILTTINSGT